MPYELSRHSSEPPLFNIIYCDEQDVCYPRYGPGTWRECETVWRSYTSQPMPPPIQDGDGPPPPEEETEQYEDHEDTQLRIHSRQLQLDGWPETLVAATVNQGSSFILRLRTTEDVSFSKARPAEYSHQWVRLLGVHHLDFPLGDTTPGFPGDYMDVRVADIVWITEIEPF